ncbi:MAG: helix-turn-helix transcriptional regulator [Alphaproteobacteria bacterium]|nr:helix-turn-helix transcriptional regulator [Alphaproteobacteria bacterium]
MTAQIEPVAKALKSARKRHGLSQRALAAKAGVPQSHISKIENAAVDLQTTSLIAIARALDMEVQLVPREALHRVRAVLSDGGTAQRPAYSLDEDDDG